MVVVHTSGENRNSSIREKNEKSFEQSQRFFFGTLSMTNAMRVIVSIGLIVITLLVVLLYFKFRKAMFVLLVPSSISLMTVLAITTRRRSLMWPIISVSMFHVVLACYALLIFSFYFFFKPFYILMISNWMFDTMHNEKNAAFYGQSAAIYTFLTCFLVFNIWQARVSIHYMNSCKTENEIDDGIMPAQPQLHQPTVLVINKPMY